MSFEPNDTNNTINLGNYEEFFILYMDNELSEDQKKMVNAFLMAHPDLQGEFDILMSTKLPLEEFSFNKEELLASNMKLSSVDEDLLLYIDNELPAKQKDIVELELTSNKHYRLQYQVLLQTKLDAAEKIVYANKEELYRRTEKAVFFKPWMRIAAAVVIIAVGGMFYFRYSSTTTVTDSQTTVNINEPVKNELVDNIELPSPERTTEKVAVKENRLKVVEEISKADRANQKEKPHQPYLVAIEPQKDPEENENLERATVKDIVTDAVSAKQYDINTSVANGLNRDIVNTNSVTSTLLERNTIESTVDQNGLTAGSNLKGSVKGFLRKATRMIEKRTGINPADDDGKLLIGSVAINLK